MNEQKVEYINIKDLVLWTENPRDPIDATATDQDIVDKAFSTSSHKWNLEKLAYEMGDYYDFSELPTVVEHDGKKVVYDGNRRMILGKIKYNLVTLDGTENLKLPEFPENIPCNVCSREIALKNVYRKHSDTGSWMPLERDIFLSKFMGEKKSPFMVLDEYTNLIGTNDFLNKRFVKEEIFRDDLLKELGFIVEDDKILSPHTIEQAVSILSDIAKNIERKNITTRKNRGNVLGILSNESRKLLEDNKNNLFHPLDREKVKSKIQEDTVKDKPARQARRIKTKQNEIFGGVLYLKACDANNLYRDISKLYYHYITNKSSFSVNFPAIIRMSLRMLCEIAANDFNIELNKYLQNNFKTATEGLDRDKKTTLSNYNVKENTICQLVQTGAHGYTSSNNVEQMLAVSIAVGAILTVTHGKR